MKSPRVAKPLKSLRPLISAQQTNCRCRRACCHVARCCHSSWCHSVSCSQNNPSQLYSAIVKLFSIRTNLWVEQVVSGWTSRARVHNAVAYLPKIAAASRAAECDRCDCRIKSLICFAHPWLQFTRAEQENKHSRVKFNSIRRVTFTN